MAFKNKDLDIYICNYYMWYNMNFAHASYCIRGINYCVSLTNLMGDTSNSLYNALRKFTTGQYSVIKES